MTPPPLRQYSDAEVVEAYRSGDKKVQQYWYDKCRSHFFMRCAQYKGLGDYVCDELFQDSFILLWEKMESGQVYLLDGVVHAASRKGDSEVPDLVRYFLGIVGNKYLELLHSGRFVTEYNELTGDSGEGFFEELYWDEDPEVEKDRIVSQCLLALPKSCLEILTLFYYERKSLEEILAARPENNTYNGLKTRKSKCISNLKKHSTKSFAKAGLR